MMSSFLKKNPTLVLSVVSFIFYVYGFLWLKEIPDNYILAQYFFSYQSLGFVKRGLIATIGNALGIDAITQYFIVAVGSGVLLSIVVVRYFWMQLLGIDFKQRMIMMISIIICPAFFSHCGYGFGRFDTVILALLFFTLSSNRLYKVFATAAVAILIHELFIIAFSLLLYGHVVRLFKIKEIKKEVALILLPITTLIIVMLYGSYSPGYAVLNAKLVSSGYQWSSNLINGNLDSPFGVLTSGLPENIIFTFSSYLSYYSKINNIIIFLIGTIWYLMYVWFIFKFSKKNGFSFTSPQIISALSPLLLSFIGIDFFRWISFSIIIFIIIMIDNIKDKRINSLKGTHSFLSINLISMVFPLGAVGFSPALSFFGKLIS